MQGHTQSEICIHLKYKYTLRLSHVLLDPTGGLARLVLSTLLLLLECLQRASRFLHFLPLTRHRACMMLRLFHVFRLGS